MHRGEKRPSRHDSDPNRTRVSVEGGDVGIGDQVFRGSTLFDVVEITPRGRIGIRLPKGGLTFMTDPLGLVKKLLGA